jgi:hypothetical protein
MNALYFSSASIYPVLRLPNFRLLMLDQFNQPTGVNENTKGTETEEPLLSIEKLVFFKAAWRPEKMRQLLARSLSLRSLIWEHYAFVPLPQEDSEEEWGDERRGGAELIVGDTTHGKASLQLESVDVLPRAAALDAVADTGLDGTATDGELDIHCSLGEIPSWSWAPGDRMPELFKPSLFLAQLAQIHGNSLEHLAMTLYGDRYYGSPPLFQRRFKILHLLEFKALTYLEFDTRLLRNRKGDHFAFPPLTKILPQSLQELSLIVGWGPAEIELHVYLYGGGFYSFFQGHQDTYAKFGKTCQDKLIDTDRSENIWLYNLFTVGAKEVVSPQGLDVVLHEGNINGFATAVSVWAMLANTGANIGGTRKSAADEVDDEDAGALLCDMLRTFGSLDDLNSASNDTPMYCRNIYIMQALSKMTDNAIGKYKEEDNGYDALFEKYTKAFKAHMEQQLSDFMRIPDGPGRKYFTCTLSRKTVKCDQASTFLDTNSSNDLTYHLDNREGFFAKL